MSGKDRTGGMYRLIVDSYGRIPESKAEWIVGIGFALAFIPAAEMRESAHRFTIEYGLGFTAAEVNSMIDEVYASLIS